MKAKFLQRLAVAFCTCSLLSVAGCATQPGDDGEPVVAQDVAVSRDTSFGGVYINLTIDQFNELGFAYGDSVDVEFSNGYELKDIPYFNGYYVNVGDPLLVGYPGYPYVEAALNYGDPLWDTAGLSDTDTATATLGESGKYLNAQEAFDISYTNERADYDSDAQFANFRALSGGKMAEDAWYRSASPVDNEYGRASYVNALAEQANVGYVLDLSDSEDEVADFLREDAKANVDVSYFEKLHNAGAVATPDLSAAYPSDSFKKRTGCLPKKAANTSVALSNKTSPSASDIATSKMETVINQSNTHTYEKSFTYRFGINVGHCDFRARRKQGNNKNGRLVP